MFAIVCARHSDTSLIERKTASYSMPSIDLSSLDPFFRTIGYNLTQRWRRSQHSTTFMTLRLAAQV
jgi:hypothetical protein